MEIEGSGGRENGRLLIVGGARERTVCRVMARPPLEQRDEGNATPEGRTEEERFGGRRESRIPL